MNFNYNAYIQPCTVHAHSSAIVCKECEKTRWENRKLSCSICAAKCGDDGAGKVCCQSCFEQNMDMMKKTIEFLRMQWLPDQDEDAADQQNSDRILLISADEEVVPVSGFLLVNRSRVFRAMLKAQYNMKESQTKRINIDDMKAAVLRPFIHFLYSACVSESDLQQHSPELFLAADKYEIFLLKQICENFMKANLTKDTVLRYLEASYLCNSFLLKKAAFSKLSELYMTQCEVADGFLNLGIKYPRLAVDFCSHLIMNSCK